MVQDMQAYAKKIREMVSDRLDLTRNVSDDEIREAIAEIVTEESRRQYMSPTEKKALMEGDAEKSA